MKTKPNTKKPALAAPLGSQPLVVLPINTDEKTLLMVRQAGYVPILSDSPDKVKVILPSESIAGASDLLMSALHGLCELTDASGRSYFAKELHRRMKLREGTSHE